MFQFLDIQVPKPTIEKYWSEEPCVSATSFYLENVKISNSEILSQKYTSQQFNCFLY
jgi:hypothetical protein